MNQRGLIVDLFAGGGGASIGIEAAFKAPVDIAINHSPDAIAVHKANHPNTKHFTSDIWEVDPIVATQGQPVRFLHASPDCTHFSRAKGNVPRSQKIRSLADVVIVWARKVRPLVITLENVPEFVTAGPLHDCPGETRHCTPIKERAGEDFNAWVSQLRELGYAVEWRVLDASLYGAPTKRKRLFLVARCDGQSIAWPEPTHGPGKLALHTAAECIDWNIFVPSIFERPKPLAPKTCVRLATGVMRYAVDTDHPYVVDDAFSPSLIQTGYGERPGQAPRTLNIHEPLGTLVDGQKHALVVAFIAKHFGGVVGHEVTRPLGTVTAVDHHSLVTTTLDGRADHAAEVRAFLMTYYGGGSVGQSLHDPLRTITTDDRFALVTVNGRKRVITDLGMRMLQPHELARAQFGRFATSYDDSAARTKHTKVKLLGNSVCPEVEEALAAANLPDETRLAG